MKNKIKMVIYMLLAVTLLFGCSESNSSPTKKDDTNAIQKEELQEEEKNKESSSHFTLPANFPKDFPLPEGTVVTGVVDRSNDDCYDYNIRIEFNPDVDTKALSEAYRAYAEDLDYNIVMDQDSFFAEGVYQFGATSQFSTNDMFIVTLTPEDSVFGMIQFKESK